MQCWLLHRVRSIHLSYQNRCQFFNWIIKYVWNFGKTHFTISKFNSEMLLIFGNENSHLIFILILSIGMTFTGHRRFAVCCVHLFVPVTWSIFSASTDRTNVSLCSFSSFAALCVRSHLRVFQIRLKSYFDWLDWRHRSGPLDSNRTTFRRISTSRRHKVCRLDKLCDKKKGKKIKSNILLTPFWLSLVFCAQQTIDSIVSISIDGN